MTYEDAEYKVAQLKVQEAQLIIDARNLEREAQQKLELAREYRDKATQLFEEQSKVWSNYANMEDD